MLYIGGAWTYGLYDPERADTAWAVVRGAVAAVTVGTLLTAAIAFFGGTRTASFARSTILLAWVIDLVLLTGWRLAFLRLGARELAGAARAHRRHRPGVGRARRRRCRSATAGAGR